ncbi:50S ribosomal protein L18 [bacterium]|nr:50S ribosomal protein L18 [bacterium]
MKLQKRITRQEERRAYRVRNRVRATGRLRLSVYRSNKQIYAQIIDDEAGQTLVAASTVEKDFAAAGQSGSTVAAAAVIGKTLAERAKSKGIEQVAFDRGGNRYHGRIKALADAAREGGLQF